MEKIKEKVLVTGGAGYIGSHTCVELLTKGFDVVILDNFFNSDPCTIAQIEKITNRKVEYIKADLVDEKSLDRVFSKYKFDSVIHFAGLKAVGESVSSPLVYYHNNVTGTINLLSVMKKHGVKKIVFSSSATVYGDQKPPYTEDMPLSTTNPYGTTKLVIENILKEFVLSDSTFNAIILRYFNPIGAHKSGLIGESPKGIPNNLAPYIMQVAMGQREYLGVFGSDYKTSDGTGVRDYIHVVDLSLGHIAALEKCNASGVHIYNLGTGKGTSVLQLLSSFEKAVGKTIPHKILARRAGDIDVSLADITKAKHELGWVAGFNINDMCSSMWNFYKQQCETKK